MNSNQFILLTFKQAIENSQITGKSPHLLLGNGFSIDFNKNIFSYSSLLEQAKSHKLFNKVTSAVVQLFDNTNTSDFELVLQILKNAQLVLPLYFIDTKTIEIIKNDAECLKQILVETITQNHPNNPSCITEEQYNACFKFLENFQNIYSLNYDLLLYWVILKHLGKSKVNDGFLDPCHEKSSLEGYLQEDYVVWFGENNANRKVYYLHGALHLYDAGYELRKYCWRRTGITLKNQILDAFSNGMFPLFVSGGDMKSKLEKITHHEYLSKAQRSLSACSGAIFVFGLSFKNNDQHIIDTIIGSKVTEIYIGIHGDPFSNENKILIQNANMMKDKRDQLIKEGKKKNTLKIYFYDSKTAKVWN